MQQLRILALVLSIAQPFVVTRLNAMETVRPFEDDSHGPALKAYGGLFFYRLTVDQSAITGEGPQVGLIQPLSEAWAVSGELSQAYTFKKTVMTTFTSFDLGLWYSVYGTLTPVNKRWKQGGVTVVDYREQASGGLRLGVGIQQYFINTSTGAIPFSGLAIKGVYDFGLKMPIDASIGAEWSKLVNNADAISVVRGMLILSKNFGP